MNRVTTMSHNTSRRPVVSGTPGGASTRARPRPVPRPGLYPYEGARARVAARACVTAMAVSMLLLLSGIGTATARVVPSPQSDAMFEEDRIAGGLESGHVTLQRGPVTLQQARTLATRRFPGRVVRAETVSDGGRRVHVIRIISEDNRVRTVRIDADTGNFM